MKKKILLITTGGTIASRKSEKGLQAGLELESYLQGLNLPEDSLSLSSLKLMEKDSTDIEPGDWLRLASVIREGFERGYEGIVLTHGTDTMSYTCAALGHLVGDLPIPIVLTGSQLPIDAQESDGPKNLRDAIITSLMDISGVMLVFDGIVMDGSSVRKIDSVEKNAFISVDSHEIGEIYEDQIELTTYGKQRVNELGKKKSLYSLRYWNEKKEYGMPKDSIRPALIKLLPGMDGGVFDYYVQKKVSAIIVEAYGTGGIQESILDRIKCAVEAGIKVYVVSQCLKGGTHMQVYEVNTRALEIGVVEMGNKTLEYIYTGLLLGILP